ncbi:hypothetical protein IEQ34_002658 [Dendrobium chrysotoxum]|uniref:Uncharacterized protein n=1 Tax=Dendrobium chrysotoxum TaxID=161865 RepID=A0AAV7H0L5_DENCH|nr:hypothetical protein IEQ34_002658 [Dendrobium chrysotoxum]
MVFLRIFFLQIILLRIVLQKGTQMKKKLPKRGPFFPPLDYNGFYCFINQLRETDPSLTCH